MQGKQFRKNFSFEALFSTIPAPIARDFAGVLKEFASILDEQAHFKEDQDKRRASLYGEINWMKRTLPPLMDRALAAAGGDVDRAALDVTARTGIQACTVVYYWKEATKEKETADRNNRTRRIRARYKQGMTQATIARKMGISQATVSRAIRGGN